MLDREVGIASDSLSRFRAPRNQQGVLTKEFDMLVRALLSVASIAAISLSVPRRSVEALVPLRDLATLAPDRTSIYVEAPQLARTAELGLEHPLARALAAAVDTELAERVASGLSSIDEKLGTPLLPALATLARNGAALAFASRGKEPELLLMLRAGDASVAETELRRLLSIAGERAGYPHVFDEPSSTVLGASLWNVGDALVIARRDALILASNERGYLIEALELAADADRIGLADEVGFATQAKSRSDQQLAWAWLDLERLAEFQAAKGDDQGVLELRAMLHAPAAQMLLGPGISALGSGRSLVVGVELRGEDVRVRIAGAELELGAAQALRPKEASHVGAAAPSATLAHGVLYRDFAGVFEQRVELFAVDELPAFAKATSDLALLFGGLDFSTEVLPGLSPWITLVAREVEFAHDARPDQPLPAVAAIFELREPARLGPLLVSAFQTGVGLANVDRAQKGLDSLLMELQLVGDAQMTTARFPSPRAGEGVDLRHNLVPACAWSGDRFLVGTHATLVADLLRQSTETRPPTSGETLTLSGVALAQVLEANFEALATNAVLEEGKSREDAERDLRTVAGLLRTVERAQVSVDYERERSVVVDLRLDLRPAGE